MSPSERRHWTAEEEWYLQENWGKYSIPAIAKQLNRSVNAVKVRAQRLGLGAVLMGGDYITLNQLLAAVKGANVGGYAIKSWVENRGLPVHIKKVVNNRFRVVYLNEFWEWAEKNRSFIDFSKMEPLALGTEPAWVTEQRKHDFKAVSLQRTDPWTPEEDSRLVMLLKMRKYGWAELSNMLHRSCGAIQRRCRNLGIKERPIKADNWSKESKWKDEDFAVLADGIRRGESYVEIGCKIGRSDKAIRGKCYFVYLTENADKIREMMGSGAFGTGAPEPTVKQAVHLSRTRTLTKETLEKLCIVLSCRLQKMRELDYDNYFQRGMCARWDEGHMVCTASCDDCDSCTEFVRIRPQYCVRCGTTFFERVENRLCKSCCMARKRQAYRKQTALDRRVRKEEIE